MMNLSEIKQYSHKIKKITINNDNKKTSYDYVTVKIHLDKQQNETVRFSYTKEPQPKDWLPHQSSKSDYFLRIPNITPSITEVYAHFFPSCLYDYTEDTQIFSIYDFADFGREKRYNQWDNMEYPVQITSYGYEMLLSTENKPLIRSLLDNSVTKYKDPNYKNYTKSSQANDINMSPKGRFPLSSRYRNSLYQKAPLLNDSMNYKLPHWTPSEKKYSYGTEPIIEEEGIDLRYTYKKEEDTSSNYETYYGLTNNLCNERYNQIPFWEAKIHKSGLSPLIYDTSDKDDEDNPINVYLNYQYLPTSTEYHQHYFGFEKKNMQCKENGCSIPDMPTAVETVYNTAATEQNKRELEEYINNIYNGTYRQITSDKTYEVLDGEGLQNINPAFNKKATYRIIRHDNPFDDNHTMYINHKNKHIVPMSNRISYGVDTSQAPILLDKNSKCGDYYTYIPKGQGYISIGDNNVKANTPYILKYFMYIPGNAYVEDDSCYVEIKSGDTNDGVIIGELNDAFKKQDKKLRHQWIYHEIPFVTLENKIQIIIKGPQHKNEGICTIDRKTNEILINNEEENTNTYQHDCSNDMIYFYNMEIAEMVEYSPVLKYTKTGLYVTEQSEYAKKPLNATQDESNCTATPSINEEYDESISESVCFNEEQIMLPTPLTDVYIIFNNDFNIFYNKLTTELTYTKGYEDFDFTFFDEYLDEVLKWDSVNENIMLQYDRCTRCDNHCNAQTEQDHIESYKNDIGLYVNDIASYSIDDIENPNNEDIEDANELLLTNLLLGELQLFNKDMTIFTNGTNNEFTITLQDAYANPINVGEVEVSIWTNDSETNNNTDAANSEKNLRTLTPNENGQIEYKRLNFKKLKPGKYFLRIIYKHECYNRDIIKWYPIIIEEEVMNMSTTVQRTSDTEKESVATSIYDKNNEKYNIDSKTCIITTVDDYPLRIDTHVYDQINNNQQEGYCELSINDKVIQASYVDSEGMVDFYLDEFDLDPGEQKIKIEYFQEPNDSINYILFTIACTQEYDERPPIPILINEIEGDNAIKISDGYYQLDYDDILFINIDTGDKSNFDITIEKNENNTSEEYIQHIDKPDDNIYTIAAIKPSGNNTNMNTILTSTYTVTTSGSEYRTSRKNFIIQWIKNKN